MEGKGEKKGKGRGKRKVKVKSREKVEKWDGEKEIKIVATVFTPCIYAYCKNDLQTYGRT